MGRIFFVLVSLALLHSANVRAAVAAVAKDPDAHCMDDIKPGVAGLPCQNYTHNSIVGDTLYIEGFIDSSVYDLLSDARRGAADEPVIKHIELNSYGGELEEAVLRAADRIRELGLSTHLRENAVCASTCVLLYMAGIERGAHPRSIFGLHAVRIMDKASDRAAAYARTCRSSIRLQKGSCRDRFKAWYQSNLAATQMEFAAYAKYGAAAYLLALYMQRPRDPQWLEHHDPIGVVNWKLTAIDTIPYGIVQHLDPDQVAEKTN